MRLIAMGTGPFAVPTLKALAASSHSVELVVSRPPRGRRAQASPVHEAAAALELTIWEPETVNVVAAQLRLAEIDADLLVVCDYGEILRPPTLATTKLGGINLHGSLLPKYRGAAPVQWAVLHGDAETGNTVIQMTPGLDAGPCLAQQVTPIGADETAAELEHRLATLGASLVLDVIDQLAQGTSQPRPQIPTAASRAPRLTKSDGVVDWARPAAALKNQVRALIPWPRAYTYWLRTDGQPVRLNLDRTEVAEVPADAAGASQPPGTVLATQPQLLIQAGDRAVAIEALQPAGKRAMSAQEFLRGNRVAVGDLWGDVESA